MDEINTSADYGVSYIAQVTYRDGGRTLHGPFATPDEANEWLNVRLELDYEDSVDGDVLTLNNVQPRGENKACNEKKLVV